MKYFILSLLLLFAANSQALSPFASTEDLPSAYQGRFRPLDTTARLTLYDLSHRQQLPKESDPSALTFLWRLHFLGHTPYDETPLFWIHYAAAKEALGLDPKQDRFTFVQLEPVLTHASASEEEITSLSAALNQFKSYQGGKKAVAGPYQALYSKLSQERRPRAEMAAQLEETYPLRKRLQAAGSTLMMLPLKNGTGEWVSLHAFHLPTYDPEKDRLSPVKNFTSFSDAHFYPLREAYFALEYLVQHNGDNKAIAAASELFTQRYNDAYAPLAGKSYRSAQGKTLIYPTAWRLHAETLYYRLPLIEAIVAAYAIALLLLLASYLHPQIKSFGWLIALFIAAGFLMHTTVLALRCFILQRPPVSNMFETVVYVPWVALAAGLLFYTFGRSRAILAAATLASLALLILLRLTQVDSRLENVQAVLDSQYWLIIHVLMVVGSYGAFAICGILGHVYLGMSLFGKEQSESGKSIAAGILHTMYLGVGLLVPGTILGGIWAAESWGRFWDWDPKESWAFITACVYIVFIHAYTFRKIADFGLAVGAVAGLMAVSFTWYGVNYVLGTGLHSYGFGKGGEGIYFTYLAIETAFLAIAILRHRKILIEKKCSRKI